jgi:hypothetical protein
MLSISFSCLRLNVALAACKRTELLRSLKKILPE